VFQPFFTCFSSIFLRRTDDRLEKKKGDSPKSIESWLVNRDPYTLSKFNSSPLKNDGCKTILSYLVSVTFEGRTVKLPLRVMVYYNPYIAGQLLITEKQPKKPGFSLPSNVTCPNSKPIFWQNRLLKSIGENQRFKRGHKTKLQRLKLLKVSKRKPTFETHRYFSPIIHEFLN